MPGEYAGSRPESQTPPTFSAKKGWCARRSARSKKRQTAMFFLRYRVMAPEPQSQAESAMRLNEDIPRRRALISATRLLRTRPVGS